MIDSTRSFALAALLVAACNQSEAGKVSLPATASTPTTPPAARVETVVATAAEIAAPVHATGTTRPIRAADLAPAMTARIEKIYVREGQQVRAGQVLVALDGRAAALGAEQARASAAAASAHAEQLDADYRRLEPLAARGSIAASRLEQLASQRTAARAQAKAADRAAAAAGRAATNATVHAPFAGTIVDLPHEVGELASMTPIARLVDLSRVEVHVRVAARDLARIAVGDPITARFPQVDLTARGTIATIGLELDPTTSTAEVVAIIDNADRAVRGGLFAELAIDPARRRTAIVVPRTAVLGTGAQTAVYAIEGGKAVRRAVEVAPFDDTRVEITSGLTGATTVVAGQLDRVRDGAPVDAQPRTANPEVQP